MGEETVVVAGIERDVGCAQCGYNLRGLQEEGWCPECGMGIGVSLAGLAGASGGDGAV